MSAFPARIHGRAMTRWLPALGAMLAAALLLWSIGRERAASEHAFQPRSVKLVQVETGRMQRTLVYTGDVRAHEQSHLAFRVGGKLLQRPAQVGQYVKAGQVLAELDVQDLSLAVSATAAQHTAAQVQHELAQANFTRFAALHAQGFVSNAEMDRHRAALDSARAQLNQARAQAQAQSNQRSYARLLADRPAVVTATLAEVGQVVAAGTPVVVVAFDGSRDAVFAVPESDRMLLQLGQDAQVQAWAQPGQQWTGTVSEIAPAADPATRTYAVKVALQGTPPPLGASVQVQIQAMAGEASAGTSAAVDTAPTLYVPSTAVWQRSSGEAAVWVFDAQAGTIASRTVQVAGTAGTSLRIAHGLQAGERIVAAGTHVLQEDQRVTPWQSVPRDESPTRAGAAL